MATADVIAHAGVPPVVAKIIGDFIDAQQASDAELQDLSDNLTATAAELNAAAALIASTTASAAELNTVDNVVASVSWAVAAGATNICVMTGTIKDAAGATIAAVRNLLVYISEAATGVGVTADSYSGGVTISDGDGLALVAAKIFLVQSGADGIFALSIEDSGKPADQYGVAVLPNGSQSISAASAALWGA